jgi:hypothetical protein
MSIQVAHEQEQFILSSLVHQVLQLLSESFFLLVIGTLLWSVC